MKFTTPIRIIHADDHAFYRSGLKRAVEYLHPDEMIFVDEAANGIELVEKAIKHKPSIVITDIKMPAMDGIQACRLIKQHLPDTEVIALSVMDDNHSILNMINAGASGYIAKNAEPGEIMEGLKAINKGMSFYCSTTSEKIKSVIQDVNGKKTEKIPISVQEIKVLRLLCQQLTTKEIALMLKLNVRTVEDYRHHLQEKTGAKNMVGLALYALINRIVVADEIKF